MKKWLLAIGWMAALAMSATGHVVTQIYADWLRGAEGGWEMEVLFEAGYAVPEIRDDPAASAPDREWLVNAGEEAWREMRAEAERYLRGCLEIREAGRPVGWRVGFPDFESRPPDFPRLLNDGAYLRMRLIPEAGAAEPVELRWLEGEQPTLIVKLPGDGGYLSLEPGDAKKIGEGGGGKERGAMGTSFRQGFEHVIPEGWDHVLFVLGLFFYRRKAGPLLSQSLAFTLAHTVTLGLAAAGVVKVASGWVEPVIALSIAAVAIENLLRREGGGGSREKVRLGVVFGFGLVHGLGFAGALSAWLKPGEGFLSSLLAANLGVEAAQVTLLAGAWVLTMGWWKTPAYRAARVVACSAIALTGGYWALERIGG